MRTLFEVVKTRLFYLSEEDKKEALELADFLQVAYKVGGAVILPFAAHSLVRLIGGNPYALTSLAELGICFITLHELHQIGLNIEKIVEDPITRTRALFSPFQFNKMLLKDTVLIGPLKQQCTAILKGKKNA